MKSGGGWRSRSRFVALSLPTLVVSACMVAALISPWSITIPPAHVSESFGFQTPACWIVIVALVAAVLVRDARLSLALLLVGEASIVGWFGWAMWVVTTQRFAQLSFPFVGLDLLGPGWYAAAAALPIAAADVVAKLQSRRRDVRAEVWLLASIPGFGLARLGVWWRGAMWFLLVAVAIYLSSLQSPDPTTWQDLGPNNVPTPAPSRTAVWVLLAVAAGFVLLSVVDTFREWRHQRLHPVPPTTRS